MAPAVAGTAWSLLLDAETAACVEALTAEGIEAILLKGPVFARWLYPDGAPRLYADIDLLVSPAKLAAARRTLERLGYRNPFPNMARNEGPSYAVTLVRAAAEAPAGSPQATADAEIQLDLHWSFHGIGASDEEFWAAMKMNREVMRIAGTELEVPSEPARALMVALHAASSLPRAGLLPPISAPLTSQSQHSLADLERALERSLGETWRSAHGLAVRLDALPRFLAGLGMVPAGVRLIEQWRSQGELDTTSAALGQASLHVSGTRPLTEGLERLGATPGLAAKARLLGRELVPTPSFMRYWSRMARRGKAGLALSYAYRPFWLVAKLPAALKALARARRGSRLDRSNVASR